MTAVMCSSLKRQTADKWFKCSAASINKPLKVVVFPARLCDNKSSGGSHNVINLSGSVQCRLTETMDGSVEQITSHKFTSNYLPMNFYNANINKIIAFFHLLSHWQVEKPDKELQMIT